MPMTIELPDDIGAWLQSVAAKEGKDISLCASEKIQQQLRLDVGDAKIKEREQRNALLNFPNNAAIKIHTEGYGYSEVRLMIDCETDGRELWVEYTHEGKPLRLVNGDFVIVHS